MQFSKKYIPVVLWVAAVFTMLTPACYYDNAEELYPLDTMYVSDTAAAISWATDVKPVVNANCAISGCHASGNGVGRQPLSTYDEMKKAVDNFSLKQRVESGSMPPSGSLSTTDKNTIIEWINNGTPNN